MSNFPQHQGTLFLGVMTLVPTAKYTTETSTPSRRRWSICFFFFPSVPRLFTTNIPEKCYFGVFSKCGCYCCSNNSSKPLWGRHSRTLEIGEVELSPIFKHQRWRRYRPKVTGNFKFCGTHPYDKKKQGEKRFPSQFHRWNFFQNFTKIGISTDKHGLVSAQWLILTWFWHDFVLRFGSPSVAYLILVYRSQKKYSDCILFPKPWWSRPKSF